MGYGHYDLPDGREAGYMVAAECDHPGCHAEIDRGLGYLCGPHPDGHRDPDEPGCGKYFCGKHEYGASAGHDCPHPPCGAWDDGEDMSCTLVRGHDDDHFNEYEDKYFTTSAEGGEQA